MRRNIAEEARNKELEYCRDNLIYYIETYCHIEDKDADELIQPVTLWPEQIRAVQTMAVAKKTVILKARQLGMSWMTLYLASKILLTQTGRTVIGLSKSEKEAMELVRRMSVIFTHMPKLIQNRKSAPDGWTGPTFEFTALKLTVYFNGGQPNSVLEVFASSPGAGRSFTADLVIFDEWAFQQFAEEIWTSAYPAINRPNGGQFIGLSTIKRGSLFEKMFTDPNNGFEKIFLSCFANPERDEAWYNETEAAMGDKITQEYPRTIEEALEVPGGAFFEEVKREDHIISVEDYKKLSAQTNRKTIRYRTLDYGFDMLSVYWIEVDETGNGIIYKELCEPNMSIRASCDTINRMTDEDIYLNLAPPDLWSRSHLDGKGRNFAFQENGLHLTKSSRDFENGCAMMKEWLSPVYGTPKLRILDGACPKLWNSLRKIQKDPLRPNVYAKTPHSLTHAPDAIRYFCVWWTKDAGSPKIPKRIKVPKDILEDWKRGDKDTKEAIEKAYGGKVC